MAIGSVGSAASAAVYQVPQGPTAKAADEQHESQVVRDREAQTGKDSAVPVSTRSSDPNRGGNVNLKA